MNAHIELHFAYDTGNSDGDPGDGRLRLDNARPSNAQTLYINQNDANSAALHELIPSFGIGDVLVLERDGNSTTQIVAWITGPVVNRGPYYKVPIKVRSVKGSFAAHDSLSLYRMADNIEDDTPAPQPAPPSVKRIIKPPLTIEHPEQRIRELETQLAEAQPYRAVVEKLLDDDTEILTVTGDIPE